MPGSAYPPSRCARNRLRGSGFPRPAVQLLPVAAAESVSQTRVGVCCVENVPLRVGADLDLGQPHARAQRDHDVRGELQLVGRVVLEVQVWGAVEQLRPLRAGTGAHGAAAGCVLRGRRRTESHRSARITPTTRPTKMATISLLLRLDAVTRPPDGVCTYPAASTSLALAWNI